jgi:hypothetical protein
MATPTTAPSGPPVQTSLHIAGAIFGASSIALAICMFLVVVVTWDAFQRQVNNGPGREHRMQGRTHSTSLPDHEISRENDSWPFHKRIHARLRHILIASGVGLTLIYISLLVISESSVSDVSAICAGLTLSVLMGYPCAILLCWIRLRFIQPGPERLFDGEGNVSFEDSASVISQQSILDQVKLWVESRVGPFRVNWYPLRCPVKSLPYDKIRIRALCVSQNLESAALSEAVD